MLFEPGLQVARRREETEVEAPVGRDHHHPPVLDAGIELQEAGSGWGRRRLEGWPDEDGADLAGGTGSPWEAGAGGVGQGPKPGPASAAGEPQRTRSVAMMPVVARFSRINRKLGVPLLLAVLPINNRSAPLI